MGADFSGVKVHTDAQADQLNQSIQAKAFTTGQDIFFRQGAYQPGSRGGQELLAHELTHTIQQGGTPIKRHIQPSWADSQANQFSTSLKQDAKMTQVGLVQSRQSDRLIQMLPLKQLWQEPEDAKYRHQFLSSYIKEVLSKEIEEIEEDTNYQDTPSLMTWDLDWKSHALRQWFALQKKLKGTKDIKQKIELVKEFSEILMNPKHNKPSDHSTTASTDAPRGEIEQIEPPEALKGIESELFDNDYGKRYDAIGKLRGKDEEYTENQGAIYAPFIKDSREAIARLVQLVGNSTAVFSLERGGALVADHIVRMGNLNIPNIKISKEKDPATEKYTRDYHHKMLIDSMLGFVKAELEKQSDKNATITVAVAETAVSGTSANTLLKTLNEVATRCPNVKIKLLLEKQTIKEQRLKGKGVLRIDNPGINYDSYVDAKNMERVEIFVSHTQYILGEDVDYQMQYANGENADKPLIVFNEDQGKLVACKITPKKDTSARDAIIDLVSGVYDQALDNLLKG